MPDPATVTALENLFSRDWFVRVWIIQEIGVARASLVLCGPDITGWDTLCEACKQIHTLISRSTMRSPYLDTNFQRLDGLRRALDRRNVSSQRAYLKRSLIFLLS